MLQPCKYAKQLSCNNCTYLYHKECKSFVVAHAKELVRSLLPFKYSKVQNCENPSWSYNLDKAKSIALEMAMKNNTKVTRLSLSQAISAALDHIELDANLLYIDCSKVSGDLDKVKGVLTSFIESQVLRNVTVVVYINPKTKLDLDYKRL